MSATATAAISIRPATFTDEARIRELYALGDEKFKDAPALFRTKTADFVVGGIESGDVLIAAVDGRIEGMAMLASTPEGGYAIVGFLVVDPGAQGLGIGRQLVEACHVRARSLGFARALLVNYDKADVSRFYEKLGYKKIGVILEMDL